LTFPSSARREKEIRADIDLDAAAGLVLGAVWGLVAEIFASAAELEGAADALRSLMRLQPSEPAPRKRPRN